MTASPDALGCGRHQSRDLQHLGCEPVDLRREDLPTAPSLFASPVVTRCRQARRHAGNPEHPRRHRRRQQLQRRPGDRLHIGSWTRRSACGSASTAPTSVHLRCPSNGSARPPGRCSATDLWPRDETSSPPGRNLDRSARWHQLRRSSGDRPASCCFRSCT